MLLHDCIMQTQEMMPIIVSTACKLPSFYGLHTLYSIASKVHDQQNTADEIKNGDLITKASDEPAAGIARHTAH